MSVHPSWEDICDSVQSPSPEASSSRTRAPAWHTNDADVTDFGPSRLDDDVEVVICPDCGKVVLYEALGFHRENCRLICEIAEGRLSPSIIEGDVAASSMHKQRRGSDVSDASTPSQILNGNGSIHGGSGKLSKKAEKRLEVEARKKARLEAQEAKRLKTSMAARRKGVTDVDTQCGVINDKGLPCSRSLTCKSHSMGAKRSVQGRSKPYDELLMDWQRIHNPGLVAKMEEKERALAASKAAAAERKHRKLMEKKKQKLARAGIALCPDGQPIAGAQAGATGGAAGHGVAKVQEDPNSDMYTLGFKDDEVDAELGDLVHAIRAAVHYDRTRILPLAQRSFAGVYTRRGHTMRSCRELLREGLRNAARGSRAASFAMPPASAGLPPSMMPGSANLTINTSAAAAAAMASANAFRSASIPGTAPHFDANGHGQSIFAAAQASRS